MSNLIGVFFSFLIGFMALTGFFLRKTDNAQDVMDRLRPFYGGISCMFFIINASFIYEMILGIDIMMTRLYENPLIMFPIIQLVMFSALITALIAHDFLDVYIMNRTYASKEKAKLGWKSKRPYLTVLGMLNVVFATFLLVVGFIL